MNDDLDVEALLEAPFQKNSDGNQSKNSTPQSPQLLRRVSRSPSPRRESRDRHRDSESRSRRHRDDSRSRYRDRSKERYRDRGTERSRRHRSRSRSSDRYSSRRHRSRDHYRRSERSRSRSPRRRPPRSPSPEVNEYDRDLRTVFVQQLAARLKQRELHNFFAKVGKVREAKIVSDRNSGRSKGVGYIEFYDRNSVPGAIALTGQKLLGIPVIVEHTESEKNRIGMTSEQYVREQVGNDIPYHRLYVGSVHFNLSEEDLKRVFEPFGPIEFVNLHKDPETGRSRGFGFVQFKHGDDAKKALEQMNGQQLNGRPIRVGLVTQKSSLPHISLDDTDNPGFALTSQSRTELMQKLARQEDESVYLNSKSRSPTKSSNAVLASSRSVILKNMFNPEEETSPNWVRELEEDVVDECRAYGTVVHIQVEKNSSGDIYLKFSEVSSAEKAVKALNGRWFGGRQVIANYIPEKLYDVQFPKAASV